MQVAELIKEYLAVLISWPVAIIIVVIILGKVFRPEIASLIGRITRIKAGPVDIASVAQEARAAGALQSKVEEAVVHSIIHPFVPQLIGPLEKTHSMFTDPAQRVRVTLYLPWPLDNEHLVQVTPYLPTGPDKTGRLLSKRVGAVGRAFITGATIRETMPAKRDDFRKKHIEQWGFEARETEQLQSDRQSYLAIPLRSDGECFSVAFFDSSDPNAFGDEVTSRAEQQAQQLAPTVRILHYQLEALRTR